MGKSEEKMGRKQLTLMKNHEFFAKITHKSLLISAVFCIFAAYKAYNSAFFKTKSNINNLKATSNGIKIR